MWRLGTATDFKVPTARLDGRYFGCASQPKPFPWRNEGLRGAPWTHDGQARYTISVPVHKDRSRVHEARLAGLAIVLSSAALILVVVYVLSGFVGRVVIRFG